MTRKGAKKGRSVTLPESWFQELDSYRRSRKLTYEKLGALLAPIVGEPVPISTIHAYLKLRKNVTEELTVAISAATGLAPPPMGVESADPEIAEIADAARAIKARDPALFRQQLGVMRALAAAVKAKPPS